MLRKIVRKLSDSDIDRAWPRKPFVSALDLVFLVEVWESYVNIRDSNVAV